MDNFLDNLVFPQKDSLEVAKLILPNIRPHTCILTNTPKPYADLGFTNVYTDGNILTALHGLKYKIIDQLMNVKIWFVDNRTELSQNIFLHPPFDIFDKLLYDLRITTSLDHSPRNGEVFFSSYKVLKYHKHLLQISGAKDPGPIAFLRNYLYI